MSVQAPNLFETQVCSHLQLLRGQPVILDTDLAWFLGVDPVDLLEAVASHPAHFPDDFVFRVTAAEMAELQRWTPCLTSGGLSKECGRLAFTTHGAGMLLTVFTDEHFALAAIPVLRAFANYWNANDDFGGAPPLVNRKS